MNSVYYNKYLKYKKKYLDLKVKQNGGAQVQAPPTLDEDIANYTTMAQFDNGGTASGIAKLLIAVRECNNINNLSMLAARSDNATVMRHIQEKIYRLEVEGQGTCNTIADNGDIIDLLASAQVSSAQVAPDNLDSYVTTNINPQRDISGVLPPANPPANGHHSAFYMPPITEAFYRARGLAVPQHILNQSGILVGLPNITQQVYNQIVQDLVNYLGQGNNLQNLTNQFNMDRNPTNNNVGHISANNQEQLLGAVQSTIPHPYSGQTTLQIFLESEIGIFYGYR